MQVTLQTGKHRGQPAVTASAAGQRERLFYVWDRLSGTRFLVDTGAEISVLPATQQDRQSGKKGPLLVAANGSDIKTFGFRTIPLRFTQRDFTWRFALAGASVALLGADFLRAHGLMVDLVHHRLVDIENCSSMPLRRSTQMPLCLSAVTAIPNRFADLLHKFPEITTPSFNHPTLKHGVELYIQTTGQPVHAHAR